MLYLQNEDNNKIVDSTYVINNTFEFAGQIDSIARYTIHTKIEKGKRPKYLSFWLENSNIKIEGTTDNFTFAEIAGSKPQETANIFMEKVRPYYTKRDSLTQIVIDMRKKGAGRAELNPFWQKIHRVDSIRKQVMTNFIKNYPNSYEALFHLKYFKTEIPKDTLRKIYKNLKPKYKNSKYAKPIAIYLNSELANVGEKYIDFTAQTLAGKQFRFSDVIGDKHVLLDFWSSGCGPCRSANKYFANEYSSLKENLKIISFAVDNNKEKVIKAAQEDSIQWTVVSNYKGMDGQTPIQYQIRGIPTFYIINPDGKIEKKFFGFSKKHMTEIKEIIKG